MSVRSRRRRDGEMPAAPDDGSGAPGRPASRPVPELADADSAAAPVRRGPIAPGSPEAVAMAARRLAVETAMTAAQPDGAGPPADSGRNGADRATASSSALPAAAPPESADGADIVALVSADRRVCFISERSEWALGIDGSRIVGRDLLALTKPEDTRRLASSVDDVIAGRATSVDLVCRMFRRDGQPLDLAVRVAHQPLGATPGAVLFARDVTDRSAVAARVRDVDRRQTALVEALADGLLVVDLHGTIVRVNQALERLLMLDRTELVGRTFASVLADKMAAGLAMVDRDGQEVDLDEHPVLVSLQVNQQLVGAVIGYRWDGEGVHWAQVNVTPVTTADGNLAGAVATFSDVTDKHDAEYALRQEREFLRVLLETLDEGIVACDAQGRMTVFNSSAREMYGLTPIEEPIGRHPISRNLFHLDGRPVTNEELPLLLAMAGRRVQDYELLLVISDGSERVVRFNGQALQDEFGWKLGAVVAMHDVTDERRSRDVLRHLAYHDQLTGLANRLKLYEAIQAAIAGLGSPSDDRAPAHWRRPGEGGERRRSGRPALAVYLLDLDGFKSVNDHHGHRMGDELLKAVADRLLAAVRPGDTVARLSGDEFVVMCRIQDGESELEAMRERIDAAVRQPYRLLGASVRVRASVGATMTDDPRADYSHLLGLADDDMYEIKQQRAARRGFRAPVEDLPAPDPGPSGLRAPSPAPEAVDTPAPGGTGARRGPIPPGGTPW